MLTNYNLRFFSEAKTPTWFWTGQQGLKLDSTLINKLESYSNINNTNCRICFHKEPSELNHIMLICEKKGMNIPPHYHKNKADFVLVMRGKLECLEFTETGEISNRISLSPGEGYKSEVSQIHAIAILSDNCIYMESSEGPFVSNSDAHFPNWAFAWHNRYEASLR